MISSNVPSLVAHILAWLIFFYSFFQFTWTFNGKSVSFMPSKSQLFNEHASVLACHQEQSRWHNVYGSNSYPFGSRITLLIEAKCRFLDFLGMTITSHSLFMLFIIDFFCLFKKTIDFRRMHTFMNSSKHESRWWFWWDGWKLSCLLLLYAELINWKVKLYVFLMRYVIFVFNVLHEKYQHPKV